MSSFIVSLLCSIAAFNSFIRPSLQAGESSSGRDILSVSDTEAEDEDIPYLSQNERNKIANGKRLWQEIQKEQEKRESFDPKKGPPMQIFHHKEFKPREVEKFEPRPVKKFEFKPPEKQRLGPVLEPRKSSKKSKRVTFENTVHHID